MNLYPLGKTLTYWFVCMAFRMEYEGVQNIPKEKGFILACNHISMFDPLFIAYKIKQPLNFMAKAELFRNKFLGWLMKSLNAFPVNRGKGDTKAIQEAENRVNKGGALLIFIEGTRSPDGKPQRARSGVSLIAGQTGADIVPCAVVYDKKLHFRARVKVKYAPVIKNENLAIDTSAPSSLRLAAKTVMTEIEGMYYGK